MPTEFCLQVGEGQKTWDDANNICRAKPNPPWTLAIIASDFENEVVRNMIKISDTQNAWIGLAVPTALRKGDPPNQVSQVHTSKFVWDFANISCYRKWAPKEPDNANGGGEPHSHASVFTLAGRTFDHSLFPVQISPTFPLLGSFAVRLLDSV